MIEKKASQKAGTGADTNDLYLSRLWCYDTLEAAAECKALLSNVDTNPQTPHCSESKNGSKVLV